ncbi:hypothetical protein RND81_12G041400 [Saponaria officinalis]|uniref:Uncharacterized protein n=1 Tax=Saponaria officinalis TaxID=3572 RepID=A0AAW1H5I6_SAPOF
MTYPPGFYLHLKEHDMIRNCPKHLCIHGLFEVKALPKLRQLYTEEEDKVDDVKFDTNVRDRLSDVVIPHIPKFVSNVRDRLSDVVISHIPKFNSEQFMAYEVMKHGTHMPLFPTPSDYATFALKVYDRFRFAELLNFVAETVVKEGIGKSKMEVGLPWVGVMVNDLIRIASSFPPIHNLNIELNFQLVERSGGVLFLHEISTGLTREGFLGRRGLKQSEVFLKMKKSRVISRDSYVFFFKLVP